MRSHDPLACWWLPPEELAVAVEKVKAKYVPSTLLLALSDFELFVNAVFVHPYGVWLRNEYLKLGIDTVIPEDDIPERAFELSSGLTKEGKHIRELKEFYRIVFSSDETLHNNGMLPPVKGAMYLAPGTSLPVTQKQQS